MFAGPGYNSFGQLVGRTTGSKEPGALISAHAGFNAQVSPFFLVGAQAELGLSTTPLNQNGANFGMNAGAIPGAQLGSVAYRANLVWEAAIVGKVGFILSDRAMIYALAGPAYGQMQENVTNSAVSMFGFATGAGLEYRLNETWSATGEFRYTALRSDAFGAPNSFLAVAPPFASNAQTTTMRNRLQSSDYQLRYGVNRYFAAD